MSGHPIVWSRRWPADGPRGRSVRTWIGRPEEAPPPPGAVLPTAADSRDADRHPPSGREAFLRRRRLLRRFVAGLTGHPVAAVVIGYAGDRPRLAPPLDGLHLSSASREGWLAFAVADAPVGIDLECVGHAREPAWNVLSASERAAVRAYASNDDRWGAFLTLWTGKEAYLKATGQGLAREPRDVTINPCGDTMLLVHDSQAVAVAVAAAETACFAVPGDCLRAACVVLAEGTGPTDR